MIEEVLARIDLLSHNTRSLVAIAGAPASGKSTLTAQLAAHYGEDAVVFPMDGFHLDNCILASRGLLDHKGAPETFDAAGFVETVQRLGRGEPVYVPVFDRQADLARAGAIAILQQRLVLIEGNYLLFDQVPWNVLPQYWDVAFWLEVPDRVIEARCIARWLAAGLSQELAERRARENDLANARLVMAHRVTGDTVAVVNGAA